MKDRGSLVHNLCRVCAVGVVVSAFDHDALAAQGVRGLVRDTATGAAIAAAELTLYSSANEIVARAISDDSGGFSLKVQRAGRYRLLAARIGYSNASLDSVQVADSGFTEIAIAMGVSAVKLHPVLASAERTNAALRNAGYYDRKKLGFGRFLDPEMIEARHASRLDQLLQGTPGVGVVPTPNGKFAVTVRGCVPRVFLDGLAQYRFDWTVLDASEIGAVEVYRSTMETPAQFENRSSDCGVILIWLKR